MRRTLAAIALLAFLPTANAQDKAKGEFTYAGEFRLRDNWMINGGGNKGTTGNDVMSRFKLDLGFKPSDRLSANMTLIHAANFGRDRATNMPNNSETNHASSTHADTLTVNQVYATWQTSDDFNLKAGRMNYQIGDGTLIGYNDWQQIPYAFEGVLGNYEAQFGRFQVFAFKYVDHASFNGSAADPEQNAYGVNFDLKTMPEILKSVNAHVIKDAGDVLDTTNTGSKITTTQGKDYLRYGLSAAIAFNMVDVKAWYEGYSGKNKYFSAESHDAKGSMMQAEVGLNFPNFMQSRLFVKYHQDSGDSDTTDKTDKTYDAYFYEQHGAAGQMDLFDWGNLTFIQAGWTGKPLDTTEVGLSYWMLSRTNSGSNTTNSSSVQLGRNTEKFSAAGDLSKSKLGDEIDLWASHKYDNGLVTLIRLSYFKPGEVFTSGALNDPHDPLQSGDKLKEKPMQVFVEARFPF